MINTSYVKMAACAASLMRQRYAIYAQTETINKAVVRLSQYSDFEDQLKRLYLLSHRLEEESYLIFCIGKAMQLASSEYSQTEKAVCSALEAHMKANHRLVVFRAVEANPDYLQII